MNLTDPVVYLDGTDYDGNSLTFKTELPVICFVHSNHCRACIETKPHFQSFAEKRRGKILAAAVDIDDFRGKAFLYKLKYNLTKVPDFLLFVNGKFQQLPIYVKTINDFDSYLRNETDRR